VPVESLISRSCLQGNTKPRYLAIADELGQFIQSGQLPTGERLPPQRKLAAHLGVTAGTISHAYAILEQRGMAMARVGDGTYVRAFEAKRNAAEAQGPIDLAHNIAIPTHDDVALAEAMHDLAGNAAQLRAVLSYQSEHGLPRHREDGARWLKRFGLGGDSNRVMVTHGAQHGLACVLRTLARPGDAVLTENLSYPGLQALARMMRLQLVGIETDDQGLLPDALDNAARNIDAKLLYCAPSLHNPTNSTMGMERRRAIAKVAAQHNLLLIEDCVHAAALQNPLPALASWRPEHSFLLSSFSKVMGPGLRVGYIEAAPQWLSKFAAGMRADCWMVAPLMPEIASRWIESGVVDVLIAAQRDAVAQRLQSALRILRTVPGLEHRSDAESPLIWLPLPEPWRASQFSAALRQAGVLVRTADHFAVGRSSAPHAVRISLNAARSLSEVESGVQAIAAVLQSGAGGQMEA
jgi:DNA-binding transcriptional MocR family regulator